MTRHADDCTQDHDGLDCVADELTVDGVTVWRTTSPSGVRRAVIDADMAVLAAPALGTVIGHLQVLHRAIAR